MKRKKQKQIQLTSYAITQSDTKYCKSMHYVAKRSNGGASKRRWENDKRCQEKKSANIIEKKQGRQH